MNREQRRSYAKDASKEPMEVTGIIVHFKNGQYVPLDLGKVQVIDRVSGKPLFDEVLETKE